VSVRRLYLPAESIAEGRASLTPEATHYLRDVLRLDPGAQVELFDGMGGAYPAELEAGFASLRVGPRHEARPSLDLWLLFALAKGDKMDWVVQKATELGATRIVPFAAERSVVRLGREQGQARAVRWRRIAAEAARQCGRADVPAVDEPVSLGTALAAVPPGHRRFVFHLVGQPIAPGTAPAGVSAVVGPEGGLSPGEVLACEAAGAGSVSLGPRVLRAETAAVVATALLQARFGDLEPSR
jgi:16S rRNA (uracil1498-N3)-methyltransferase